MPAAPIHATPHFVAFFVAHVVVYASSQDFVETALGQPYLHTKGAFLPAPFPIPGISPHPDHIQTHTIPPPHKPGSAALALPGLCGDFSLKLKRHQARAAELEEPAKCTTKRRRQSVRRSVGRSVCCSYPCHATLRRFLRPTRCRLRFVARLCRECSRPAIPQHKRGFPARAIPDTRLLNPSRSHPDSYNFPH
jgi:hypothetical protein